MDASYEKQVNVIIITVPQIWMLHNYNTEDPNQKLITMMGEESWGGERIGKGGIKELHLHLPL